MYLILKRVGQTPYSVWLLPEHKSTFSWLWDTIKTPLIVFGTVLIGFIFFDYIPYTSEWIRKIPCLPTILNTIEYIPNKIGNWIGSWFTNPTTPPAGGDNPPVPNVGNKGKGVSLPPAAAAAMPAGGEDTGSSKFS